MTPHQIASRHLQELGIHTKGANKILKKLLSNGIDFNWKQINPDGYRLIPGVRFDIFEIVDSHPIPYEHYIYWSIVADNFYDIDETLNLWILDTDVTVVEYYDHQILESLWSRASITEQDLSSSDIRQRLNTILKIGRNNCVSHFNEIGAKLAL